MVSIFVCYLLGCFIYPELIFLAGAYVFGFRLSREKFDLLLLIVSKRGLYTGYFFWTGLIINWVYYLCVFFLLISVSAVLLLLESDLAFSIRLTIDPPQDKSVSFLFIWVLYLFKDLSAKLNTLPNDLFLLAYAAFVVYGILCFFLGSILTVDLKVEKSCIFLAVWESLIWC